MNYKKRFTIEVEGEIDDPPADDALMECLHKAVNERMGLELGDVTGEDDPYYGMTDQEKIVRIAEETDGRLYNNYSGRGMYGEKCMGITHRDSSRVIAEAGRAGLKNAKIDGMGMSSIIYWEQIKPMEDFEEDDN